MPSGVKAELTGKTFGKLTVKRRCADNPKWLCVCECGGEKKTTTYKLKSGRTSHCGCESAAHMRGRKRDENGHLTELYKGREKALRNTLKEYKASAKSRSHRWDLSDTEAMELFERRCHYCGSEGTTRGGYDNINGIDRRNSERGYTKLNCVACCETCNYMKGTMKYVDFVKKCKAISLRH